MKTILALLFVFVQFELIAQFSTGYYLIDFESSTPYSNVVIEADTVSNQNNVWQIGRPSKSVLNTTISGNKVLITDTMNPYSSANVSYFYIKVFNQNASYGSWFFITYNYQSSCNGDTAYLEYSPDNGVNWYNLNDTNYSSCYPQQFPWGPGNDWCSLTGNAPWSERTIFIYNDIGFPCQNELLSSIDTLLFRFSFYSDSDSTNNTNGVAIDDFEIFIGSASYISEQKPRKRLFYPSPNQGIVNIRSAEDFAQISVFNEMGEKINCFTNFHSSESINLTHLQNGVYIIVAEFNNSENQVIEKILIFK
ncbi:MAG: T9SS type A sorting domain-containing protein [Bacteroidales bacterium]|nr:T9SS type A sorting domain-containing protein [Bacteroidales bacterium]